jgi:hypothetical protein
MNRPRLEVFHDVRNEWRWRLVASLGAARLELLMFGATGLPVSAAPARMTHDQQLIAVIEVLDDALELRTGEKFDLAMRLVDALTESDSARLRK